MFDQQQIDLWMQTVVDGDNNIVELKFSNEIKKSFITRFLVELKMQVDRWDLLVNYFIFNTALESFITNILIPDNHIEKNMFGTIIMWGTTLEFSPHLPVNTVLAVDTQVPKYPNFDPSELSRSLALGKIDLKRIERLYNLKAFW